MNLPTQGEVTIHEETDIVVARRAVREAAAQVGFGHVDTTRIVTAASELARNTFKYGAGGVMYWRAVVDGDRRGLELRFEDHGPGIPDLEEALQEGFSSAGGLGMGLPGAKRLMDEMELHSTLGAGTTVIIKKWLRHNRNV
jgi:serine/threonine-protein kinase RsbT